GESGDHRHHRHHSDSGGRARSVQSKHGTTSSLSENEVLEGSWLPPFMDSAALRRTFYCSNAASRLGPPHPGLFSPRGEARVRGTEAGTFEPAGGIASGMPMSESDIPIRLDP